MKKKVDVVVNKHQLIFCGYLDIMDISLIGEANKTLLTIISVSLSLCFPSSVWCV